MHHTNALIDALLDARCYPHRVGEIELKQTHISWVVLAGDYAYKIKKPVELDFLDFSTLERRRFYCQEELRLNRRFAPGLYLDVVPISGPAQAPRIGGENAPIEYAVRLRRFEQEEELGALLDRNAVTCEDLNAFGKRLAGIHDACSVCVTAGSASRALQTALTNLQQLERAAGSRKPQIAAWSVWMKQQWEGLSTLAERRRTAGRVRDCHGDLHAGNVVRLNGQLTPFDCIEFDPQLRCIDVMEDAAFLVMDLLARNRPSLAYAFLNGWLEAGGDYDAVPLLRFSAVHRALVRAKVVCLRGDTQGFDLHLRMARSLARSRTPMLMLTCGLSGSGKTWLSERLMNDARAIRVRSDVERKRLAGLSADEASHSMAGEGIYTLEFNTRVYAHLFECARTALGAGENVIVDAAFLKRSERLKFIELARERATPVMILHCVAADEELRRRLQTRQRTARDASEADVSIMQRQISAWEPLTETEQAVAVEVRTDDSVSVGQVKARVASLIAGQ